MSLKKPKLALFDLDGTLVDTAPDIAYSVNCMLNDLEMGFHDEQIIRSWIGNGVEKLIHRALTGGLDESADSELYDQAFPLFSDYYAENAANRSRFYPGVEAGLSFLKTQDMILGIITNKRKRFTEILLTSMNIAEDFSLILCGDSLPRRKPDPMPLLHAARLFDIEPEDCLMIGDSINDVASAQAAGFPVLGVDYGYNRGIDIRESNPDMVVSSLSKLTEIFH